MQKYISLIIFICLSNSLFAQSWDLISNYRNCTMELDRSEKEVIGTILTLFNGMRDGDSSMVSSVFHSELTMHTQFTDRHGKAQLKEGSAQSFLQAVGTPHIEVWDEKLGKFDIKVDQKLAQVWTEYYFFLDDQFLHSGTNFFQLYKTPTGWLIYQLSDTRKKKNQSSVPSKDELW